MSQNEFGVDSAYFRAKLGDLLRDLDRYPPDELARALARLARTADERVLGEDEFQTDGGWVLVKDGLPAPGFHVETNAGTAYRNRFGLWFKWLPGLEIGHRASIGEIVKWREIRA